MTVTGPWYISARAVREYHRIATGSTSDPDDEQFDAAAIELGEAVRRAHFSRTQRNGLQLWRLSGTPRLRLLVSTQRRQEGELPQLVNVLPEHDQP